MRLERFTVPRRPWRARVAPGSWRNWCSNSRRSSMRLRCSSPSSPTIRDVNCARWRRCSTARCSATSTTRSRVRPVRRWWATASATLRVALRASSCRARSSPPRAWTRTPRSRSTTVTTNRLACWSRWTGKPIADATLAEALLKIFASRIVAEIDAQPRRRGAARDRAGGVERNRRFGVRRVGTLSGDHRALRDRLHRTLRATRYRIAARTGNVRRRRDHRRQPLPHRRYAVRDGAGPDLPRLSGPTATPVPGRRRCQGEVRAGLCRSSADGAGWHAAGHHRGRLAPTAGTSRAHRVDAADLRRCAPQPRSSAWQPAKRCSDPRPATARSSRPRRTPS